MKPVRKSYPVSPGGNICPCLQDTNLMDSAARVVPCSFFFCYVSVRCEEKLQILRDCCSYPEGGWRYLTEITEDAWGKIDEKNNFWGIFLHKTPLHPRVKPQDGCVWVYIKETFPASMDHELCLWLLSASRWLLHFEQCSEPVGTYSLKLAIWGLRVPILMLSPWCALLDLLWSPWVVVLGFLIISNMHN